MGGWPRKERTSAMKRGSRTVAVSAMIAALAVFWAVGSGCGSAQWRTSDGRIVTGRIDFQREATTGRVYHLYIPSTYNPKRSYPLVITAQGTFPFDEAMNQRNRWVEVAEKNNLIVCSADFDGATGWLGIPKDRPPPELVRDEKATLAIIQELEQRYSIRKDAIMITGWSGGGYPAHFIGLRHPEVFRCIVGRAANFGEHLVTDDVGLRARHMHVYVFFGAADLPGFPEMNRNANFWYTVRGFRNFVARQLPGGHDPNQAEAGRYFLDIINHWPSVRIESSSREGKAPLTVGFQAFIKDPDSPDGRVDTILWNLGDNTVAARPDVVHTYTKPGLYNVFLTVVDKDGHHEYAQTWIQVD
jgi:poly(3-hydroxybutyrate) depolymerase